MAAVTSENVTPLPPAVVVVVVGGDVVEVAPPFDPSGNTALVGATMMFEILCVVAESVARRKQA